MKALAKSIQIQYDKGCTDIEELAKINNVSINDVKKFLGKEEDIDRVAYFKKLALDEAIFSCALLNFSILFLLSLV